MFSKEYDNNLKISKIHHKRKENSKMKIFGNIFSISLVLLIIGIIPGSGILEIPIEDVQMQSAYQGEKVIYPNNQLVLLDVTYDHNTVTRAFSFFSLPSGMPSNLISPINYAQGTLYQKVQIITKPSSKTVKYQYCMFQDQLIKAKHACTNENLLSFTSPGTYYASQNMTALFQYGNIQWYRNLLTQMLVVKDINGKPVDDRYGWVGTWSGSPNFGLYYPMKVHYTAIIVPPGGGAPIWPSGGSGSNGVIVVSPNGGESLVRGITKTINWTSTGSPGANVKIELLKGGYVNSIINSYTLNDGSYSWTIPPTQTIGSDYKVRVKSTSNPAYSDTSNNNFAISGASITVISPNGGENWQRSTTKTMTWTKSGSVGSYVKIELLKGGSVYRVISWSTPNDGSHSWYVPSVAYGTDYKVRITSTSNLAHTDTSNNNFKIY